MAEKSGDNLQFQQALETRMQEEIAKGKLITQRVGNSNRLLEALGSEKAQEIANAMKEAGRFQANSQWVSSMLESGIPHDAILKAWDIKDQHNRDLKGL